MKEIKPIIELYERASKKSKVVVSDFLSPDVIITFEDYLMKESIFGMNYTKDSGFTEGERCRLLFFKDFYKKENIDNQISLLKIHSKNGGLEHRAVLGSILGLGIVREKVGDIFISKDGTESKVAVDKHLVPFFFSELNKIGFEKIRVETTDDCSVYPRPLEKKLIILSSYRLNGFISKSFKLSRGESQDCIQTGRVKMNHRLIEKSDYLVSVNDLVSCRGKGRFKVLSDEGKTKKDRFKVTIGKYV